ncbi:YjcQ family protein [Allobaculum mucilyticum]|nr:YjcQ family protein [Allobaculum mucilyticum]
MTNNDIEVVIYKILAYLYECKKAGKYPDFMNLYPNSCLLHIPKPYWSETLEDIVGAGLIQGLNHYKSYDGDVWQDNGVRITLKGIEYLRENNGMQKAKEFLGFSFQSVLADRVCSLTNKM